MAPRMRAGGAEPAAASLARVAARRVAAARVDWAAWPEAAAEVGQPAAVRPDAAVPGGEAASAARAGRPARAATGGAAGQGGAGGVAGAGGAARPGGGRRRGHPRVDSRPLVQVRRRHRQPSRWIRRRSRRAAQRDADCRGILGAATFSTNRQVGTNAVALTANGATAGGYVVVPSLHDVAPGAITLSIWVFVNTAQPWQRVIDLGNTTTDNIALTTHNGIRRGPLHHQDRRRPAGDRHTAGAAARDLAPPGRRASRRLALHG